MFKSARWRGEKNRIKEVFKLQLHATQVSQPGVDTLTVSLVPADLGKPTLRLQKAIVRDGTCRWENPAYETVKFVRDPKTSKINERIYRLVVSSGSSKASLIGEVTIDFSDYAEATKPSTISLPLNNPNSNMVLHVLIRRLQNIANEREMEETGDVKIKSQDRIGSLKSHFSFGDTDDSGTVNSTEDDPFNKTTLSNELNVNHRASSGSDITLSSSDDYNHSSHGTHNQESCEQASDVEVVKLRAELVVLGRQIDVTELELQTLRKQIVKESKRGQDLSREVISLREERNALEAECEKLKAFQNHTDDTEGEDLRALLEETRKELDREKDQNANLRIQLQKTQESNAELVLAVQDLEEMLEQKDMEISDVLNRSGSLENIEDDGDEEQKALEELVKEHTDAKDTYMLEQRIVDLCSEIEIYRRDKDELEMQMEQLALDYEILKQECHDLSYRLEQSTLQEQLKMQYECSSSLEVDSLERELKKQSKESSDSLATINKLEAYIKRLEEDLEKQSHVFEADVEALMRARVEQEQRAIQAEEALRKMRWKNADTAERIQEEFRRLSTQMASTFEANEKMAMKAVTEAGDLRMQKIHLEEMLRIAYEEIQATKDDYEVKLFELSKLLDLRTNQIEQMFLENGNESKQLENQGKLEEEKETELELLQSELQRLKCQCQCNCLMGSLFKDEIEKDDLKKKNDVFTVLEKKQKNHNRHQAVSYGTKTKSPQVEGETGEITSKHETLSDELLTELASLKEKNKSMESELMEMQERYSEISLKFAEVEGERQQLVMTMRNLKNASKSKSLVPDIMNLYSMYS